MAKEHIAEWNKAWDSLDPNSWGTNCADCGTYYQGVFTDEKGGLPEMVCPSCGSRKTRGLESPASGGALLMRMDF